jgi:hypothetical protein
MFLDYFLILVCQLGLSWGRDRMDMDTTAWMWTEGSLQTLKSLQVKRPWIHFLFWVDDETEEEEEEVVIVAAMGWIKYKLLNMRRSLM